MNGESGSKKGVTSRTHRRRLRVLGIFFGLLAAAYLGRGVYLQLAQAEHWKELAEAQHAAEIELPAERGGIYDREGRPLAVDDRQFRAFLAPAEVQDQDWTVEQIRKVLGLRPDEVRRLREARNGWVAIPRRLGAAERDRLAAAVRRGLHFRAISSRENPEGDLAIGVLGRVDSDGHGRSGLELGLDSVLTGRPGLTLKRVDALGGRHPLPSAKITPPTPGHHAVLTLDARLQTIAENALDRGLEQTGASGGDIVLLDVKSGEILAVASRGTNGGPAAEVPAFTDPYEPGSTAKPFLLASLLEEGKADLDDRVYAEGGRYRVAGRTIEDVHPHDTLTVEEVIQFSSNVGAAKLAERLTPGQQYRYLRDFGFGTPTGLLYPSESAGTLRKPGRWSSQSQASLAMGYELAVTSVQMAAAYAALANDGRLLRPYLVKEIRDAGGKVIWRQEPETVRQVISPERARQVSRVLTRVVEGGTATQAAMKTLHIAGKTGTSRLAANGSYRERRYAASFVGFTPADDARLLVLTRLIDPQGEYYGGLTAAPVSRTTLEAALATRGLSLPRREAPSSSIRQVSWNSSRSSESGQFLLAASDQGVSSPASPAPEASEVSMEGRRVLPDLRGLSVREAVNRLHELGLHVRPGATGQVRNTGPAAGARVAVGDTVILR